MSINRIERLEKLSSAEKALLLKNSREKDPQIEKSKSILPRTPQNGCPLSFAQQRLWFFDQLERNSPRYNIPFAFRLDGELSVEVLKRTLTEVARRHEILRTAFALRGEQAVQVVKPSEEVPLRVIDLSELEERQREAQAEFLAREEAQRPFDLAFGRLWRASLLRLGAYEHVALFTMHHVVSDGWSIGILIKEVAALYDAYLRGEDSPLPELEIQYADYAVWQREYLSGVVLKDEIGYWKDRLKGAAVVDLPTDHARPAAPSYRGGRERVEISKDVREGLRRFSQRNGVTLFMALMAAFKVVLMRYSGEEDISVGTAVANRARREVKELIGLFVNTLVLRTDLGGNPSFSELVRREREVALGAYARQDLPFEKLVEEINPGRDLSRNPLFQVMMVLQNTKLEEVELGGLKIGEIDEAAGAAIFDLMLTLTEEREAIVGSLEYSLDLYKGETIRRMARHYERVVAEAVRDAEQRIREIELLTESERDQVLMKWNDTAVEFPKEWSIQALFEEQVELIPESVAVVCEEQELSYQELNHRANQLAHHLRQLGVGPEVVVGLCVDRGLEMIIGLLGIIKAGGAYLPLDPRYPAERLGFMLEDGDPLVLLTQRRWCGELPEFRGRTVCMDRDWPLIAKRRKRNPPQQVGRENLAYVLYTSGSTGRPKGVMGLHGGAINRFAWAWHTHPFTAGEVACQKTSLNFIDSMGEIFVPLLKGIRMVIIGEESVKDPTRLAHILQSEQVTRIVLVPSLLRSLLEIIDDFPGGLGQLKYCSSSGEALSPELSEAFANRLPKCRLLNLYGSSEASADASWCEVGGNAGGSCVPIGRPIANTQIYLLDTQLHPVPAGIPGELFVSGGLARSYLNQADLTAEKFIPNSYNGASGERLYKSGDLGRYLEDGNIEFLGRIDNQVKIRGFRVELGEIESQLRAHPAVRQCVAIAHQDKTAETQLVGYVVCKGESEPSVSDFRAYLRKRLPEYMLPARFVRLEQMPLLPNGKVDRRALPDPALNRSEEREDYAAPRTAIQEVLARIFQEALRLDRVGIHDDFFETGGHSLLATQVVLRVKNTFGVDVGVRSIFEASTVAKLAEMLTAQEPEPGRMEMIALLLKKLSKMTDEDAGAELAALEQ